MDFKELLNDIAKLEGFHLSSIRPGADIVVEKVDIEQEKIVVRNSSGKIFNRSVVEFQRIWDALISEPAVRVEEVLNGSGSSRNQPETIFANLPYIEWLKVNNKKHISFVGKSTHPYGTIKEMDEFAAIKIKELSSNGEINNLTTLISTNDLSGTTKFVSSISGTAPIPINNATYSFSKDGNTVVVIDADIYKIPTGTYGAVHGYNAFGCKYTVNINGIEYGIILEEYVKAFYRKREL